MYIDTFHRFMCDKCKRYNFIDAGNMNDMTIDDPQAYKCWNCGHKEICDPESQGHENIKYVYFQDGLKDPYD